MRALDEARRRDSRGVGSQILTGSRTVDLYIYHDSGDVDLLTEASLRLGPIISHLFDNTVFDTSLVIGASLKRAPQLLGRASSEPHSYVLTWLSVTIYIGIDGPTSVFDPAPGVKVGCCGQNLRVVTLCANDLLYFTSSSNSSLIELRRSLAFDCQH